MNMTKTLQTEISLQKHIKQNQSHPQGCSFKDSGVKEIDWLIQNPKPEPLLKTSEKSQIPATRGVEAVRKADTPFMPIVL